MIRAASVPPLFPVWKTMSAPVVPTPLVERSASVDVVPVPPITSGTVALVVMVGVARVGLVANTLAPVPVSSVNAAARFADVGVARNVATPVARPATPVAIGSPVQLLRVPEAGVPRIGAVSVLFDNVSVVARPTSVSVAAGNVSVPDAAADG